MLRCGITVLPQDLEVSVTNSEGIASLTAPAQVDAGRYGERAARLSALARAGAPVPAGIAIAGDRVADIDSALPAISAAARDLLATSNCLIVRASPEDPSWGGPASALNLGYSLSRLEAISNDIGALAAETGFVTAIRDHAIAVAGADGAVFEALLEDMAASATQEDNGALLADANPARIRKALEAYEQETDRTFPQDPIVQLCERLKAMSQDWSRPSARILRTASGAPEDAALGLIVQRQVDRDASGQLQSVDPRNGHRKITGTYRARGAATTTELSAVTGAERTVLDMALRAGDAYLKDAARITYALSSEGVHILDLATASRSDGANLQVIVDLVDDGVLTREQALLKADPRTITAHLFAKISPGQVRETLGGGIAAGAGAGQGPMYFSAEAVQAAAARGTPGILVRTETDPEDIRGMTTAAGVLTLTGGLTSHAAVIAQGLGVPCVVGASSFRMDHEERKLIGPGGQTIAEGEVLTVDGTTGEVHVGALELERPDVPQAFAIIMDWADETRELGVRANADTLAEARAAREFGVDGIGLCRTEHMFYEEERINVMRELILAQDAETRQNALERLLPFQRDDFCALFGYMEGLPVTIRLLDPPLHEFLPSERSDVKDLAEAMDLPARTIRRRIEEMQEFNPMLGMRGVRLAVTMPEIYEMQARAIFEAALATTEKTGQAVVPEIMIPLVSAQREVELVKGRLDAVARTVEAEKGTRPRYRLGVMVETPRAALRAGDLAGSTGFLSFGTNDLTQMTYGLSRDDSGRFMREYVNEGVFPEDPFLTLDLEAVGELMLTAARRGRKSNPYITLGLCGEHGGDPASVRFCQVAGFDYVSCSPYRVPIARLAAAQAALLSGREEP